MDINLIVATLKATLEPNQQKKAEEYLSEMHKIIGFSPALLEIVMSSGVEIPVRQAGVIYLKNLINTCWKEREAEKPEEPVPFCIHEQDKHHIRDKLVEAIIEAPEPVRVQLKTSMQVIIREDFPGRWDSLQGKIYQYLVSPDPLHLMGALLSLYALVKTYEYKKSEERDPLNRCMSQLLPVIQQRITLLLPDNTDASVAIQKVILKTYYALTQFCLPNELMNNKQVFGQWIEIMRAVMDCPVPDCVMQIDEEDRHEAIWWKCKKWAMHLLTRLFDRYGSPGGVLKQYNQFAEWFLKSFSEPVIVTLLKICERYRKKEYVAPRVMQQIINYFETALPHAFSWKFLKPHFMLLVKEVIFPMLCHNDKDTELWSADPHEYVRVKYDIFEDMVSPSAAAISLLSEACVKRKGTLEETMRFCMHILNSESSTATDKDGAFHMIGAVSSILLKRKLYKEQMEDFLVRYVLPVFGSPEPFLRSRACWLTGQLADTKFRKPEVVRGVAEASRQVLCSDSELPVKIEAASCLVDLLSNQNEAQEVIKPHLKAIFSVLLELVRETENDDVNSVLRKAVCVFDEEIVDVAEDMTRHLADTLKSTMNAPAEDDDCSERSVLVMGILGTIETILQVLEEHKEVMLKLEVIIVDIVGGIFQNNVQEFYEESLSLTYSLTCQHVSPVMWQIFRLICQAFERDAFDFFPDMMPALHNYITVDKEAFLADPQNIESIFNMCSKVLHSTDAGEDAECHAGKLLEVILIDCKGLIDTWVARFIELALDRLTRQVFTSELRTMCIQVVIAAIWYNSNEVLKILTQHPWPGTDSPILTKFFAQWLNDTDCFLGLHDRKLSVLGLCVLLQLPATHRPDAVTEQVKDIIPSMIVLFKGLKRAYAAVAEEEENKSKEGGSDDGGDVDYKELDSDEDDVDEEGAEYLEMLEKADGDGPDDEDDDDDDEYIDGETALEAYDTKLDKEDCPDDEYIMFHDTLMVLQANEPNWYQHLLAPLDADQQKTLKETMELAVQRRQQRESKRIEQDGGYSFQQTVVPPTFNFGGSFPGPNPGR